VRRTDLLITEARGDTENLNFTDDTGIQDREILGYVNRGQNRIQALIQKAHPGILNKKLEVDVVTNQREYDVPADLYLGTRIEALEYSMSGDVEDYVRLRQNRDYDRSQGIVTLYRPRSSGKLRFVYEYRIPRLDTARGTVLSVVLDSVNSVITSLVLDPDLDLDVDNIQTQGFISIVDRYGVVKMQGIPVTAVDASSGTLTIASDFVFESGETIAVGDTAVLGAFSSTHSQLPDVCEDYLIEFMKWKMLKRDSSNDSVEQNAELKEMEDEIVGSFAESDSDTDFIPILDDSFFDDGE
jgi:hypothetical protein